MPGDYDDDDDDRSRRKRRRRRDEDDYDEADRPRKTRRRGDSGPLRFLLLFVTAVAFVLLLIAVVHFWAGLDSPNSK